MADVVLDSCALLAFLHGEYNADTVRQILKRATAHGTAAHMTELNYAEVKYITLRKHGTATWEKVLDTLGTLPIQFHPLTRDLADIAADYKAKHALSLADACAAALAKSKGCPVVTGDPEFKALEAEISIQWI